MKTNISEDLPARKFAPAASAGGESGGSAAGGGGDLEKKAKQLVYDAKYEVRKTMGKDTRMDPAAVTRAVLQRIDKSEYPQPVKMRARRIVMGDGQKTEVKEFASQNVANALYSVFVEHSSRIIDEEELKSDLEEAIEGGGDRKYKVRVTDKKTGNSYIRWADRSKISELRANPNIVSVEMIDLYGSPEPNESERSKGSQTASVTAGKGIARKDYDGDGKIESGAKEYRGSVHNAIQRKKGGVEDGRDTSSVREEFIGEGDTDRKDKQIKPMKGKNDCVKVYDGKGGENNRMGQGLMNHQEIEGEVITETGYSKFLKKVHSLQEKAVSQNQQQLAAMAIEYLDGNMPDASDAVKQMAKMGRKELKKFASTKHEGLPEKVKEEMECGSDDDQKKKEKEIDPRQMKTIRDRLRAKLGLMGLRMSYEPEGEVIDEAEQRIRQPRQSANPRGTYDTTGIGQYPRTGKERKKMRKGEPVDKYPSLERKPKPMNDDENPPRRRYRGDDHPSLTAAERNPGLR